MWPWTELARDKSQEANISFLYIVLCWILSHDAVLHLLELAFLKVIYNFSSPATITVRKKIAMNCL